LQFGRPPNRIDLLNQIEGVSFAEAWETRVPVPVEIEDPPLQVLFIDLGCLLKNKEAAGRGKDLEDLRYLKKARARMPPCQPPRDA
jgi:hypothetical protein